MEPLDRADALSAIREFTEMNGAPWAVPLEAGIRFMTDRYYEASALTVSEVTSRYLGEFTSRLQLAHSLAAQSFPPRDAPQAGEFASVDWSKWPFNHINWVSAADELEGSITAGHIVIVDGRYFFDTV